MHDLLIPSCVIVNFCGTSKKQVLEYIANLIHKNYPTINAQELFKHLLEREKLGNTSIDRHIALPHCQIDSCSHPLAAAVQLSAPIPFDTVDDSLIKLIFVLVMPINTHNALPVLNHCVRILRDSRVQKEIYTSSCSADLYEILTEKNTITV